MAVAWTLTVNHMTLYAHVRVSSTGEKVWDGRGEKLDMAVGMPIYNMLFLGGSGGMLPPGNLRLFLVATETTKLHLGCFFLPYACIPLHDLYALL